MKIDLGDMGCDGGSGWKSLRIVCNDELWY
jgi:hypothetical protein